MRLLVTGGAGFIGSTFIRYILKVHPDWQVVNVDDLTYAGNPKNLGKYQNHPSYSFIKGDICDIEDYTTSKIFISKNETRFIPFNPQFDWIINFAAQSHVDRSIDSSFPFLKTNILGTHALLEFARKHSIPLLQISTDEVFGEILEGSNKEDSPLKPGSPYSASKASADLLVQAYHRTHNLPYIITRSTNNYGPYQYPEKLIPYFTTQLVQGKKVGLYGDGKQVRDWLWVEDHVRAIELLLEKGDLNEIYNIGSGEELTNLEVTRMILKILKLDDSWIEFVEDRKGHDRRYSLDTRKTRALGWKPMVGFGDGLAETIGWYSKNRDWWGK